MAFRGTGINRGTARGIVVATGLQTELGCISELIATGKHAASPLERKLEKGGHQLIALTLGICVLVTIGGVLTGKDLLLMVQTGIALAVAAVPEGLPIVATFALARGMWRMAQRKALIERLSAVETLGATTVYLKHFRG